MDSPKFQNVLLIDDNEINNVMQEQMVLASGFGGNTVTKQSSTDALEYLQKEVKEGNVPDVIFLDIRMPVMDGFEFMDEFKKLPDFITGKSKIIVLTSSLEQKDHSRALTYPFVKDYIVKPLTLDNLNEIKI